MVDLTYPAVSVIVLVLAILIDLLFGDPPWRLHPTFLTGRFIIKLEHYLKNPKSIIEKLNGAILAFAIILMWSIPIYFGLKFVFFVFGLLGYILIAAIFLKLTFSIKLETTLATAVAKAVETDDLPEGRKYVSLFSRRNTKNLSGSEIVSAIVESIAENLADFKLSCIIYYAFFNVPGAFAFRTINNLDSVVGFKDKDHINIGWFTATLDTIANYIPSRFSALLIVFSSAILGEDWKAAWRIARRDRKKISSINHGWPIAAIAGALQIKLEKPGYYVVGDKDEELSPNHIRRALRIRYVAIVLCVIMLLPILLLTNTVFSFMMW